MQLNGKMIHRLNTRRKKKDRGRAVKRTQTCRHRTARSSCLHTELNCLPGIKRYLRQPDEVKARQVCETKACRLTLCAAVSERLAFWDFCPLLQTLQEPLLKKTQEHSWRPTDCLESTKNKSPRDTHDSEHLRSQSRSA